MSSARVAALFRRTYGRAPQHVASAPGRVNLIGEHTDYNGGAVLPIAIERRTWVALAPGTVRLSRAISDERGRALTFRCRAPRPAGRWTDYLVGVLRGLGSSGPWDVAVISDVPSGAGLSSSAALEVAFASGLSAAKGQPLDPVAVARLAHQAESEFVGVRCGIMDQYASACARPGHALYLSCDTAAMTQVPFARSVLVVDTASPRGLRHSAFNERRAACERALAAVRLIDPEVPDLAHASADLVTSADMADADRRCARHVVSEQARVAEVVSRLQHAAATGAQVRIGELLLASHASLRDDYACSTPELDWVVEWSCREDGVDGARLTGAGWGGCAVVIGEPDALAALADRLPAAFGSRWGRPPRAWLTRADEGARVEQR